MLNYINIWNIWLGRRMFFVVLSALLFGFTLPLPTSEFWNWVATLLFTYMTFVTALDTSLKDFIHVLTKPWINLWMLLLIHGVMPLLAFFIGILFYPDNAFIRLGFLIGATIPIGVTSIIWTSLAGGDVALSMVAVTLDTLISPVLLPLFITLVAGRTVNIDAVHLLVGLFWMITVPSLLGMAINDLTHGTLRKYSQSIGGFTSKIAIFGVVYINASAIAPEIHWNHTIIKLLLVILIVSISGYSLGYIGSYVLKGHQRDRMVSMIYGVGMRNNSLGLVLALTYFPVPVALPVTLAMLYQQPLAAFVSYLLKRFDDTGWQTSKSYP
ncbi:Bile acid:sodium symporter [Desulfotomaculum nigrificans CO-1-SRB]|uniref:Bile acid:sodium symporter n=1 Tax=Desulfotomaculum nigrificans (strain DSM 14880 / VKM B-2319 / CO-1-SRB) TaxID=868595 RepID=F6B870_DESCC|nr:bile acid:sodium symporter family protein [Desulfotomaculum nigrificans]AEF93515.1 Bile acid:sodium symporter [Desulfotomaculum nigrificans CO-1-SRB]